MQFPASWLAELVEHSLTTEQLCQRLTLAGLEVEDIKPVAPPFSGVVAARVVSVATHPNADKLKLCMVDCGEPGKLQIVCGAPNVAVGLIVPCALVGANLPGMAIKAAKVRGVESFGMLCSARELGLSDDHGGLLVLPATVAPGANVRQVLNLDDTLITLKLTPNRADCLSILGIAREVAALTGAPLKQPTIEPVTASHQDGRTIQLDVPQACARYCGRLLREVDARAATPVWMKDKLERCGLRPISALVDVTNYVMLELGQPLHAFDNARLMGGIQVRQAFAGEQLTLLNGDSVTLTADTALIADDVSALALAGVMGGAASAISLETTDVFLESAWFAPQWVVGKARTYALTSDAAHRYERGVDAQLQRRALERATRLMLEICGGSAGPLIEAVNSEYLPQRPPIRLRSARVWRMLGIAPASLSVQRMADLLTPLGGWLSIADDVLQFTPPSWRFDLAIEADLIEEIARLYGYDNIPQTPPRAALAMRAQPEERRSAMAVRHRLAERGFFEVVTYSFVAEAWETDFAAATQPIRLANPLASQMSVMRSTLLGGLAQVLATNRKRQMARLRIFEIGRCFSNRSTPAAADVLGGYQQSLRLAALAAGDALPEQWGAMPRRADFFDLKGDLEALFAPRTVQIAPCSHPALHPGRAAAVWLDGEQIGVIGEMHPRLAAAYELGPAPLVFEIDLIPLLTVPLPRHAPVSRQPAVVRDLSLVAAHDLQLATLLTTLQRAAPAIVREIRLFDVFQGHELPANTRSLAFRLLLQDTDRSLTDAEVDAALACLIRAAQKECNAVLRQ